MIKGLKKMALVGMLTVAGGAYSGGSLETNSSPIVYHEKLSNFLGKQSELFIASDLEKKVREERESFIEEMKKPLYLTEDLVNNYIKQAQKAVGKLPKEIDKRLFRLMLKQESGLMMKNELVYDAHAVSKTGYMGIGQVGYDVYKTFRPEKWESFRDPVTEIIDTLQVKKEILNPVVNMGLSIQYVNYISKFCEKNDKEWGTKSLKEKREEMLLCYNAGHGKVQKVNWNKESKKLKKENRDYPTLIMTAYNDPSVKVKL